MNVLFISAQCDFRRGGGRLCVPTALAVSVKLSPAGVNSSGLTSYAWTPSCLKA